MTNEVTHDPWKWVALVVCSGLLLSAPYMAGLVHMLHLVAPDLGTYGFVDAMSIMPALDGPIALFLPNSLGLQ
ncbi:MAG: hypothetical protein AB7F22_12860 [Reyranella sp.]|uniref:hypothetical protein n=1 Tax=Reyranella sp. TaxID=1929291 RepID=UPI003D0F6912